MTGKQIILKSLYVLALTSLCFSASLCADTKNLDRVVAIVDDNVIMASELEARLKAVHRQINKAGANPPPEDVLKKQVLDKMIVDSVLVQNGERAGVKVSDEQLAQALSNISRQNKFEKGQLKQAVEAEGLSWNIFREDVRRDLLVQQVQQGMIARRVSVTEQEITNFLNSEEGKMRASVSYRLSHILIAIPPKASDEKIAELDKLAQNIAAEAAKGGDFAALASGYSNAQDALEGGDLGWRNRSQLPGVFAGVVDGMQPGQSSSVVRDDAGFHIVKLHEIKAGEAQIVYQTHARHILLKLNVVRNANEAQALLASMRANILDGGDFFKYARKYSDDTASALKGGDLGWTTAGQLVPEFQSVIESLPLNEISEPFQSQYGWHIVQVLERREQDMTSEVLRQKAHQFLANRKYEEELPRWLNEIRSGAYVDIKL